MLRYSLEAPPGGSTNEYHNICFCGEIRKLRNLLVEKFPTKSYGKDNKWPETEYTSKMA